MKTITKSVVVIGVGILAVTTMLARSGGHSGQPVHTVRFTSRVTFTNANAGVDSTASGTAQLSTSINRNTDRETLSINAKGLTPSGSYSLFATAFGSNQDLIDFNADKRGSARLNINNTGNKRNPAVLPAGLEMFSVTELDIQNDGDTNTPVTVLTADTTSPTSFTFSSTQTQTGTNGETGTLSIRAGSRGRNGANATLSLNVSGLDTNTAYLVALNGTSATNSFTSDSRGNLRVNNTPITANVLDLTEVDLTDTSSDIIIAFPLP